MVNSVNQAVFLLSSLPSRPASIDRLGDGMPRGRVKLQPPGVSGECPGDGQHSSGVAAL